MTTASLIPQKIDRPSLRAQMIFAVYGIALGAVIGLIVWAISGAVYALWAAPVCGVLGIWLCRARPNVLWQNQSKDN